MVASRLATSLSRATSVEAVAREAVRTLHESFDYYLAVVQRLDPDGMLRVVAAAGPLAEDLDDFLELEQSVERGVNGRVARTGRPAMVNDTRMRPRLPRPRRRHRPGLGALAADRRRRDQLGGAQPRAARTRRLRRGRPAAGARDRRPGRRRDPPLPAGRRTRGRLPDHDRGDLRRGRAAGRLHRQPRRGGRRAGARGRRTAGDRRRRARPPPLRRPPPRRRQDRHPRRDHPQARTADRRGARPDGRAHRDRRADAGTHPLPRPGRAAGPLRPRAPRRRAATRTGWRASRSRARRW